MQSDPTQTTDNYDQNVRHGVLGLMCLVALGTLVFAGIRHLAAIVLG